ncbi:MAG: hypothetical protein Q8K75_11375 [Chlamydiales bacterium]|nr:hypothetical protein [Chlamydiales bacterium]
MESRYLRKAIILVLSMVVSMLPDTLLAVDFGGPVLQIGAFTTSQKQSEHVDIDGLIGDDFNANSSDENVLLGIGYYVYGFDVPQAQILYGVNAFYFSPTKVKGKVTQEDLFTNLSYRYSTTYYPIFFAAKALFPVTASDDITLNVGIGPNIVKTKNFRESSLDGVTLPDQDIFTGKSVVVFSAMVGIGWRINDFFGDHAIEIDYRFFYLGRGELQKTNSQLRNNLHTGIGYANALFISVPL